MKKKRICKVRVTNKSTTYLLLSCSLSILPQRLLFIKRLLALMKNVAGKPTSDTGLHLHALFCFLCHCVKTVLILHNVSSDLETYKLGSLQIQICITHP